jgi:CubicO group peptidase (beta-lactamase class C family)
MATAERVGLSSERLALLDRVMKARYVDTGMLPGFHTMIHRDGELAHDSCVGLMDTERGTPLRDDTIHRIYSMSKPITAVALMMLVEEGALGLDDDVRVHIPSWKKLGVYASGLPGLLSDTSGQFVTVPPKRPMKVIDLVRHTSGLTYGFMHRTSVDAAYRARKVGDVQTPGGLDEFIEQLSTLPLDYSPGDMWTYSVSIDVMGYLVQKLSGLSFGEFLRTRLFEPLKMHDTAFY